MSEFIKTSVETVQDAVEYIKEMVSVVFFISGVTLGIAMLSFLLAGVGFAIVTLIY